MSAPEQACPSCGRVVTTPGLEPFNKIICPGCGSELRVERTFENYKIVEPLGSGGMGSVYKACDTRLNRLVAIKILRKEFADDENFIARLQKEAQATASIRHPHVLEIFSVGSDCGQFYVVMELVDGGNLDDQMEDEQRIPELRALEVGIQVAQGLQAALQAGLIHRDIKPGNILFADPETTKIVDFGLAALAEQHAENDGEIWGTPYYVAPERLTNAPEDFRSDLYSLGATLFHAIAGRPTFEDETSSATELKKLKANPVRLQKVAPDVSAETAAVIDRMLRPEPADRQASYRELIDDLQAARVAILARAESRLCGRWGRKRILVSLGTLLLAAAIVLGVVREMKHLRQKSLAATSPPAATSLPLEQIAAMRREMDAEHYEVAEAGFQAMTARTPDLWPMADLAAALQLWEQGDFAQAAARLQHFPKTKPAAQFAWMKEYRSLAQNRLDDYLLFTRWEKTREFVPNDPEKALGQIREIMTRLKTKGALAAQLTAEQTTLTGQVAVMTVRRSEAEKKLAATEAPTWLATQTIAGRAIAGYGFEEAVATLQKVQLTSTSLLAARDTAVRRTRWLADWKTKLIADINSIGFGGALTDLHGVRYDGPVRRATTHKLELKTHYGTVMTDWLNLSPQTLLTMSTAFIRPGIPDVPERQWLSAIFAQQTGQAAAARDLAQRAAATKPELHGLLPRFFPDVKK